MHPDAEPIDPDPDDELARLAGWLDAELKKDTRLEDGLWIH